MSRATRLSPLRERRQSDGQIKVLLHLHSVAIETRNRQLPFDTIDATKLRTQFNYKIYTDREFPKDKVRQIGTVSFSKVAYSSDRNKSAVYTSFICGGLCGSGQILFFEKINGVWKYIKSWDMWVS